MMWLLVLCLAGCLLLACSDYFSTTKCLLTYYCNEGNPVGRRLMMKVGVKKGTFILVVIQSVFILGLFALGVFAGFVYILLPVVVTQCVAQFNNWFNIYLQKKNLSCLQSKKPFLGGDM